MAGDCPVLPALNDDEIAAGLKNSDVTWDCTKGFDKGSVCTKTCNEGFAIKGPNNKRNCGCKGKDCEWKKKTSACLPKGLSKNMSL